MSTYTTFRLTLKLILER